MGWTGREGREGGRGRVGGREGGREGDSGREEGGEWEGGRGEGEREGEGRERGREGESGRERGGERERREREGGGEWEGEGEGGEREGGRGESGREREEEGGRGRVRGEREREGRRGEGGVRGQRERGREGRRGEREGEGGETERRDVFPPEPEQEAVTPSPRALVSYFSLVSSSSAVYQLPPSNMATDELSSKLSHRLQIEEGTAEPVAVDVPRPLDSSDEKVSNADAELSAMLSRREALNQGQDQPRSSKVFNPYTEFKEFSRKHIKDMEREFSKYDVNKDNYIDMMELKLMMERAGKPPQTHLGLKNMMKEVDEDLDSRLSFREVRPALDQNLCREEVLSKHGLMFFLLHPHQFLLIFRKAAAGELADSGLCALAELFEIDVSSEGVKGAKSFFEAKVGPRRGRVQPLRGEIRQEQELKKKEAEEEEEAAGCLQREAVGFQVTARLGRPRAAPGRPRSAPGARRRPPSCEAGILKTHFIINVEFGCSEVFCDESRLSDEKKDNGAAAQSVGSTLVYVLHVPPVDHGAEQLRYPACIRGRRSTPGLRVLPCITLAVLSHLRYHDTPTRSRPSPAAIFVAVTTPKRHRPMEVQLTSSSRMTNIHRGDAGDGAEASSAHISPVKASKTHNELHRELLLAHKR
ncbi:EF-hand domain-containing protein D2 [Takifugu flavidus]|uniref:EF-hand domain-containing protein D2 n=1 Tax=Takifugu flavidus TaxID=433684 RepID=A0A5C6MPN2_9TELE|nr:EF-hand domain-containing protein D2 [Takifugu flavidus]